MLCQDMVILASLKKLVKVREKCFAPLFDVLTGKGIGLNLLDPCLKLIIEGRAHLRYLG